MLIRLQIKNYQKNSHFTDAFIINEPAISLISGIFSAKAPILLTTGIINGGVHGWRKSNGTIDISVNPTLFRSRESCHLKNAVSSYVSPSILIFLIGLTFF